MKLDRKDPPRAFRAGPSSDVVIRDCGRLFLDADEQITFVTPDGAEHDVARKTWGFYATASLNARLPEHRLHAALVRNEGGRYYVFLVEDGRQDELDAYLRAERQTLVAQLDDPVVLRRIEAAVASGPDVRLDPDNWLAAALARPTFRVTMVDGSGGTPLRAHVARHPGAFYYGRVPTDDVASVTRLVAGGMVPVDVGVTLVRPGDLPLPDSPAGPDVHEVRPSEVDEAVSIAGRSFRYSRFHLDPAFPKATSDRVKREWIANVAAGRRGEALLVVTEAGRPVGFLAVLTTTVDGAPCAVIDLVGVDPPAQGRGYGRALVHAFIRRYGPSHPILRVGTQAANVPSLVMYQRSGFVVASTQFVLHLHTESAG